MMGEIRKADMGTKNGDYGLNCAITDGRLRYNHNGLSSD